VHIGVGEPAALVNLHPELLVFKIATVAAVRRHHLEGGRLEAFEPVGSGCGQPAQSGSPATVQHRHPELLTLGERSAV
jgi:hypothetical protein